MKEKPVIERADLLNANSNPTILFPYPPIEYWEKIRNIIREEVEKKDKPNSSLHSAETPGMTYKPLYKVEEVCSIFSVSRQTIYQWIDQGLLKPHKVRSRVYFLWTDLESLIKGQKLV